MSCPLIEMLSEVTKIEQRMKGEGESKQGYN